LVAITDITGEEQFDKIWMEARNTEELRDIILMGERNRAHMLFCRYSPDLEEKLPREFAGKEEIESLDQLDTLL